MRFSGLATAVLSIAGIARSVQTTQQLCEGDGPWVEPISAGDLWTTPAYQHFCEAGYSDGDVLTGVKIWKARWQIHAIQFRWGKHDYGRIYGQPEDPNAPDGTKEWDASTKVAIRLWHNKPDDGNPVDAVGKIRIQVEGQDAYEVAADDGKVGDEIHFSPGAGLILATAGAQGAWISTLQFYYLESQIIDTKLTSINFLDSMDKFNEEKKGMQRTDIWQLFVKNENALGEGNITYNMNPKIEKDTSKTVTVQMSHTVGTTIGFKISEDIGLPGLIEVKVEGSWEVRYDFQHMKSEATTETETFSYSFTVGSTPQGIPPQTAMDCRAVATIGTFDSDYTGQVTAKLDNGKTFTYNDAGNYKSVGYADATSGCKQIPLSEVPENTDATVVDGNDTEALKKLERMVRTRSMPFRA